MIIEDICKLQDGVSFQKQNMLLLH